MNRVPPIAVRRELRKEVGFGCPIQGCGNPYLMWHHFDPRWSVKQHHDPAGMIALCADHHNKADAGTYSDEQLRRFKAKGQVDSIHLKAKFEWLRHNLLPVVGGNFYYLTNVIFAVQGRPAIWFSWDDERYHVLNVDLPTTSGEPRVKIEENFWLVRGMPTDVEAPPHGRILDVRYANGDRVRVEFKEVKSPEDLQALTPEAQNVPSYIFPIVIAEVQASIAGTGIDFGPKHTTIGGFQMKGNFFRGFLSVIDVPDPPPDLRFIDLPNE